MIWMKIEIPIEGVINFYQAISRFVRYCEMCRGCEDTEQKVLYSGNARDEIDIAYYEYLQNIPLILAIKGGSKPVPIFSEIKTEKLKEFLEIQLKSLNKEDAKEYLRALNNIKGHCPVGCEYEEIKEDIEKIKELAEKIKELVENLYLKDVLDMVEEQLKSMIEDPEKFRNIFILPPKPLIDEYRL
ncbi:MAG: hypothetical protein ACXQTS_00115 [Candidatus Methanospirareceae archaeon]